MMDARTQASIQRLAKQRAQVDPLQPIAAPKQILAITALGRDLSAAQSGGLGIASPLTEGLYSARTWHTSQNITSTDGLITMQVRAVDTITLTDANDNTVQIILADPNA
jgi:hypothetical protein